MNFLNFPHYQSPLSEAQWGEAISLNILNVTAIQRRSALGPADQSSAPLSLPIPNAELTVRDKCFSRDAPSLSNCLPHLCKNVHDVHV